MPRDGSGVYSTPPGTHGTPNTTILSANYNSNVDDVATDLNTPRPIVAGGTGATTAASALTAIGAVAKAGDTMTGDLTIAHAGWPRCIFNVTDTVTGGEIDGRRNGSARWSVLLLDGTAESGSNAGSDFWILRYSDAGVQIDAPLFIKRSNGAVNVANSLAVATAGSITGLGEMLAVSANGPSKVGISIQYVDHGMILIGTANPTYPMLFYQGTNANMVGSVVCTPTATAYNTASDVRLKEDLKSFDAGRIVDETEVYNFKWKSSGERSYGVSAQQAQEVYPEAVTYIADQDWFGIDYSRYVPVLLQELKALRARVAALEGGFSGKPA